MARTLVGFVSALLLIACGGSSPPAEEPPVDHAAHHPGAEDAHGHHGQGHHHDFSDVERFARIFEHPERDTWQMPETVVELLAVQPGMVVADIGAGTGYFLPHLVRAVGAEGRILALDTEPNMVEYMQNRIEEAGWKNVEARVSAPDDPGLEPGSVDRILIVDTWHHIAERPAYAAKLRDALREGGVVMIVDFTRDSPQGPPPGMRMSADEAAEELRQGGLSPTVVDEPLPYQWIVTAERN